MGLFHISNWIVNLPSIEKILNSTYFRCKPHGAVPLVEDMFLGVFIYLTVCDHNYCKIIKQDYTIFYWGGLGQTINDLILGKSRSLDVFIYLSISYL